MLPLCGIGSTIGTAFDFQMIVLKVGTQEQALTFSNGKTLGIPRYCNGSFNTEQQGNRYLPFIVATTLKAV
jgi:hypothetical protein